MLLWDLLELQQDFLSGISFFNWRFEMAAIVGVVFFGLVFGYIGYSIGYPLGLKDGKNLR